MVLSAAIVTFVGAVVVFLILYRLIASAMPAEPAEVVIAKLYTIRKRYFFALTTVLVIVLLWSFSILPYNTSLAAEPDYVVPVTGRIWSWQIGPAEDRDGNPLPGAGDTLVLPSGSPIEFQVAAGDVNHGFGIYDESGELVAQTQAMPGYVNSLFHTFEEPGVYQVLCMEFCGLGHHTMMTTITVE